MSDPRWTEGLALKDMDSPVPNPFWDQVRVLPASEWDSMEVEMFNLEAFKRGECEGLGMRDRLTREFSWAIPDPLSLAFIAEHARGRVVEIGAGTGYWAHLLTTMGMQVQAYDAHPVGQVRNHYHDPAPDRRWAGELGRAWFGVQQGRPWHASRWPHHTLMLSWPPYTSLMADSALRHYRGDRLIYIGEGEGGCTADDAFHARLARDWSLLAEHRPLQWSGIHDWILVYERA